MLELLWEPILIYLCKDSLGLFRKQSCNSLCSYFFFIHDCFPNVDVAAEGSAVIWHCITFHGLSTWYGQVLILPDKYLLCRKYLGIEGTFPSCQVRECVPVMTALKLKIVNATVKVAVAMLRYKVCWYAGWCWINKLFSCIARDVSMNLIILKIIRKTYSASVCFRTANTKACLQNPPYFITWSFLFEKRSDVNDPSVGVLFASRNSPFPRLFTSWHTCDNGACPRPVTSG